MPDSPVPDRPRTRLFCAVLIAAPLLEVVEALLSPLTGGTTAQDVAAIAAAPGRFALSVVIGMIGTFLLVPALLGLAHRASARSPKLGLVTTVAVGLFGITFTGIRMAQAAELAIATSGVGTSTAARLVDALTANAIGATIFGLFLVLNVVGLVLLVIALWRSRRVPIPALVLLLVFPLIDLASPSELGAVVAHLVLTASFTWMAIGFLRAAPVRKALPAEREAVAVG